MNELTSELDLKARKEMRERRILLAGGRTVSLWGRDHPAYWSRIGAEGKPEINSRIHLFFIRKSGGHCKQLRVDVIEKGARERLR